MKSPPAARWLASKSNVNTNQIASPQLQAEQKAMKPKGTEHETNTTHTTKKKKKTTEYDTFTKKSTKHRNERKYRNEKHNQQQPNYGRDNTT